VKTTLYVRMSEAYDEEMNRTPERDDWLVEDAGEIPDDRELLKKFASERHPKALQILARIE